MRRNPSHAGVLDAEFLPEQGDFLSGAIQLRFQPHPRIDAVGRPTAGMGQCELGQGDGLEHGGLDRVFPKAGKANRASRAAGSSRHLGVLRSHFPAFVRFL
jgi:hypothetical protein